MRRPSKTTAFPFHRHAVPQALLDGGLVALAYFLAYRLRFDQGLPEIYDALFERTWWWAVLISVVVFGAFRMYQRWWRYTGQRDFLGIVQGVVVATLALAVLVTIVDPVTRISRDAGVVGVSIPNGVLALHLLLTLLFVGGARFVARTVHERPLTGFRARKDARRILIVGAGDGGRLVLREIVRNAELGLNPVGFVDDDKRLIGTRVDGVRVLGDTEKDLPRILDEVEPDEVTIAIPSAPGTMRARIVRQCRERGIPVRTLPTVFELLQTGGNVVRQVREIQVEDVLGREPVVMDIDRVGGYLQGEVVMVTGAGGSIGSELCRQIARVAPRRLILLDHAEDNLFRIQRELEDDRHVQPSVLAAVLADCKEGERMREVFAHHRPTVVFHAAAYKHVGLMELNPVEAVRNNAIATRLMARIAGESGVKRFVLVSTDKAVSPATVMGASKALAEFAVEAAGRRWPGTRYASVRFGNVLGSSGSVVPIFRRQIALGGPVTVTDERMTRYFMTIPEAVQLIIRSGSMGTGGEIFVLEMGEPVSILQLAKDMIELSGLTPGRDIAIEVVGRRPGEKLDEDLFNDFERIVPTDEDKIRRAERETLEPETVEAMFDQIQLLVLEGDAAALAAKVSELSAIHVPGAVQPSEARAPSVARRPDGGSV
ncbi:NAD-dependent epimerase/dehydratase family protein [Conexibacter sp. W3-3-2]|uniref:Polysaccharide biosynthesis protein n=1 Tax=Paraconexibacter algicola TaxID=2133960 RepID=A0A2T4UIP6_9ACTN|nr:MULTISPECIES: nucleoside-diphosphate sugar epimerase/dehydratase [Solirubrobacterales]MTD45414.1 NAD-dependent epimerase/dehydratase family protein [Conexibacter sp. W3-3-2]PTL59106.1 polysaccharide biosynthesis protein [Paraconexibacter algicola]